MNQPQQEIRATSIKATPRLPHWLKKAAFESALIVFSIVLALLVNEWRENRALKDQVQESRELLAEEIQRNRDTLLAPEYLRHHETLLRRCSELVSASGDSPNPIFESGVHPAPLRDAAWRSLSAQESFAHIPYREIVALADLYQAQSRLETMHWTALSIIMTPQPDNDVTLRRGQMRTTALYLNDVVSSEHRLLESYAAALKMLH